MKTGLFILLISVIFIKQVSAQNVDEPKAPNDSLRSLTIENVKTHKRVSLEVGQAVGYKLRSSKHFEKGRIIQMTDSTISFEYKKSREGTFMHKDLTTFKIPKSTKKKFAGSILMVGGVWILVGTFVNPAQGELTALNIIANAIGLVAIVKGYSIESDEKIYLDESWSWTLKTTKVIEAIKPRSVINVTLKNGETIEEMKVEEIDSEKIKGVQISRNSRQQFVSVSRTIMIADIEVLNKKK